MSKLNLGQIISGIQQRDHKVLSEIYKIYYPIVLGFIVRNGGNEAEAKDVFQESILIIYKHVQDNELNIREDFEYYITGIARKIWYKKIRQDNIHENYVSQSDTEYLEDHPSDKEIENELEMNLIRKHILQLGYECQQVLLLSAQGVTNEEIAKKLGYKSEKIVRTKKYKCKEALLELIKADPLYKGKAH